jgi:hypothetical protein
VHSHYRLSHADSHPSNMPFHPVYTADNIQDEGITELFNYLSDTSSEKSKPQSAAYMRFSNQGK